MSNMKLIMENWNKFVNEEEPIDDELPDILGLSDEEVPMNEIDIGDPITQASILGAMFALATSSPVKWAVTWVGDKIRGAWAMMGDALKSAAERKLKSMEADARENMLAALRQDEELQGLIGQAAELTEELLEFKGQRSPELKEKRAHLRELSKQVTARFNKVAASTSGRNSHMDAVARGRQYPDPRAISPTDVGHKY